MDQTLLNIALSLSLNAIFHTLAETTNVRAKVKRLAAYMDKKPYKEMPVNIDTRAKAYGASVMMFVLITGVLYGIFSFLSLDATLSLKLIIAYLVVEYFLTAVLLDKYHVEIEQITKKFKK